MKKIVTLCFCIGFICAIQITAVAQIKYKLLATKKTSTMQKELNQLADEGYRFEGVSGGSTSFGGSEVLAIMSRAPDQKGTYKYILLATSKTSTMQKELQEAGDNGYEYRGQVVFETFIGGDEVVTILEKDPSRTDMTKYEYKLYATKKTSTMEKELNEAGDAGYSFVGVTVGKTFVGGAEVVVITRKKATVK